RCFKITTSSEPALTTTTFVPLTRAPATNPPPSIVTDLVMGIVPKPPVSSTSISPPGFVLVIAPANVLHGVTRRQLFASSPKADMKVRFSCPTAVEKDANEKLTHKMILRLERDSFIKCCPLRIRCPAFYQEMILIAMA